MITDPRTLDTDCPHFIEPDTVHPNREAFVYPLPKEKQKQARIEKGPNIQSLPSLNLLPEDFEGPILLKAGDDVSTGEIIPAGSRVLPIRGNIPTKMGDFVFADYFVERARDLSEENASTTAGFFIIAGENHGQGSSRGHAALVPRYLGLRCVIAKSYGRVHWQNLINFGGPG